MIELSAGMSYNKSNKTKEKIMATGYTVSRKNILTSLEPLRFGSDGKFRILHLTDIHKVHPDMDDDTDRSIPENKSLNTLYTIEKAIELSRPDLIVFGGDNIGGHWDEMTDEYALWCIEKIIEPVKKYGVPLAIVFGNHDSQNGHISNILNREIQMSLYMNYDNFRGCFNEADVYGCGNYHLHILAHDSDEVMWNVWCVDSNDYPRNPDMSRAANGYDAVHADQLKWYEDTVKAEKESFGRTIPAVLFQHIPVNQEFDFMEECTESESNYKKGDKFFRVKDGELKEGLLRESPCPPSDDREQFEAWKRCGDIKAAFFGHDHTNTFRFEKDGISLYQSLSCGYEAYGMEHGGRIITLYEGSDKIETETIVIDPKY